MRFIQTRYSILRSICLQSVALMIIIYSMTQALMATVTPVPEIDGSSLSAGLGLLAGVTLIVIARRNRK
jgi:hypothetical protein